MAYCFNCEKGNMRGRSHSHHRGVAGGRWKKRAPKTIKVFKPNLQAVTVVENGISVAVRLCTKCIKRIKKDTLEGKVPFLHLITLQKPEESTEAKVEKSPKKATA